MIWPDTHKLFGQGVQGNPIRACKGGRQGGTPRENGTKADPTPTEHRLQEESRNKAHARRGLLHHALLGKGGHPRAPTHRPKGLLLG
ncbi:MAG TPA: hypothetical protein VKZ57_08105 [Sphingobacterium sp.]|nr:hypothetical protein [Sphingobacterium sp.]